MKLFSNILLPLLAVAVFFGFVNYSADSMMQAVTPTKAWYGRFAPQGWGAEALTHCSRDSLRVLPITALSSTGGVEDTFEGGVLNQAEWQDTAILKIVMFQTGGQQSGQVIIDQGARCVYMAGQTAPAVAYVDHIETRDSIITDFVVRNVTYEPVGDSAPTGFAFRDGRHVIFSNISTHFTSNDAWDFNIGTSLTTGDTVADITMQYFILGPLVNNARLGGQLIDDSTDTNVMRCGRMTFAKGLWVEGIRRAPNSGCGLPNEVINTISYNNTDAGRVHYKAKFQFINMISKYGPGTNCAKDRHITYFQRTGYPDSAEIYLADNWAIPHSSCGWTQDTVTKNWGGSADTTVFHLATDQTPPDSTVMKRNTEFQSPPIPVTRITSAVALEDSILASAGNQWYITCEGVWTQRRDLVDSTSIMHVDTIGGIDPDNPLYNGRSAWEAIYGTISKPTGTWCTDKDGDDLPDDYETRVRGAADSTSLKPDSVLAENVFVIEAYLSGLHIDSLSAAPPAAPSFTYIIGTDTYSALFLALDTVFSTLWVDTNALPVTTPSSICVQQDATSADSALVAVALGNENSNPVKDSAAVDSIFTNHGPFEGCSLRTLRETVPN